MSLGVKLIHAARRLLVRAHEEIPAEHGVSLSDALLLLSVHTKPGCTVNDLASDLSRDKTTISRSVSDLSDRGMLRSELDSLDGRRKNLYLTEEGHRVILPAFGTIEDDIEAATEPLEDAIVDLLTRMSNFLVTQE